MVVPVAAAAAAAAAAEEGEEEEEEVDDEDVEASLDEILKERLVVEEEEAEDEEVVEPDDRVRGIGAASFPSSPTNSSAARASSSSTPASSPIRRRACAGTACERGGRAPGPTAAVTEHPPSGRAPARAGGVRARRSRRHRGRGVPQAGREGAAPRRGAGAHGAAGRAVRRPDGTAPTRPGDGALRSGPRRRVRRRNTTATRMTNATGRTRCSTATQPARTTAEERRRRRDATVGPFVAPPTSVGDASSALAIPSYDSLSASQVVQRLDGLSPAELHEVRAHETAHRRRRTILHRVEQLLAGQDASPDVGARGRTAVRWRAPGRRGVRIRNAAASCASRPSPTWARPGAGPCTCAVRPACWPRPCSTGRARPASRRSPPPCARRDRGRLRGGPGHRPTSTRWGRRPLGVIDGCYVEPGARGVGVGRALLDAVVAWLTAVGLSRHRRQRAAR